MKSPKQCWVSLRFLILPSSLLAHVGIIIAAAFRPPSIRDELGCSPNLSFVCGRDWKKDPILFDPLQIANDENFPRLREAELKSGRTAMIAVVETIIHPILCHYDNAFFHIFFPSNNNVPIRTIDRLMNVSGSDALKVIAVCGILETFVFIQRSPTDMPGDYSTGWFGDRDKGKHETRLIAELEHGRLAMMGFVAQLVIERVTNQCWNVYWLDLAKHLFVESSATESSV